MSSELLTSPLQDSLASLIRWLASGKEAMTNGISGLKSNGFSARLSPDGSWERTYQGYSQLSMDGSLELFSQTWARWGIVAHGVYMGLERLERHTDGNVCSLWPTFLASEATHGGPNQRDSNGCPTLTALVHTNLWPTPRAHERQQHNSQDSGVALSLAVKMWPTPTALDSGSGRMNRSSSPNAAPRPTLALMARRGLWPTPTATNASYSGVGYGPTLGQAASSPPEPGQTHPSMDVSQGSLNPEWVEMLMGFPPGYTAINGPLSQENRKKRKSHRARP